MKRTLLATLTAIACFAAANQVLAQSAPPNSPNGGARPPREHGRDQVRQSRAQRICDGIDARLDGRLTYTQSRLKITDKEKGAWDNYAKAMRASLDPLRADCASGAVGKRGGTIPQRLDAMQHLAEQRLATLKALKPATETLYASLSPDQQKVADRVLLSTPHAPRAARNKG